jgi:hypothetical protein
MHPLLTKRFEFPRLPNGSSKIASVLEVSLGVLPLTILTIVSSLTSGIAFLLRHRVGVELGVYCEATAALGPIWCLFMVGLLTAAFLRTGRRQKILFGIGTAFGLAAFAAWSCAVILEQLS